MRRLKGELRNGECRSRGGNPVDEKLGSDRAGFHLVIKSEGDGVRASKLGWGRDSVHSNLECARSDVIGQIVHQDACLLPGSVVAHDGDLDSPMGERFFISFPRSTLHKPQSDLAGRLAPDRRPFCGTQAYGPGGSFLR